MSDFISYHSANQTWPYQTNSLFSLSLLTSLQTNLTHPRCLWAGCFDCARRADEWRILAEREVKRACRLTSGRHVERWHGWMIPTEGLGRASTWETACALFSNRWQHSGDWREKTEDRVGEGGTNCGGFFSPSSPLIFMTFAFYLPLTTAWGLKRGKTCFYLSQDSGLISYLPAL